MLIILGKVYRDEHFDPNTLLSIQAEWKVIVKSVLCDVFWAGTNENPYCI